MSKVSKIASSNEWFALYPEVIETLTSLWFYSSFTWDSVQIRVWDIEGFQKCNIILRLNSLICVLCCLFPNENKAEWSKWKAKPKIMFLPCDELISTYKALKRGASQWYACYFALVLFILWSSFVFIFIS